MTLLQSIILGVVEGITEFFCRFHRQVILASRVLVLSQIDVQKIFEIPIRSGNRVDRP
jgi:undecaprenyl pyrophosphate phosphatase UppP